MTNDGLTLFSWGYEGWGNWTDKLVAAVDAVETSRGYGPPLFVDIRARRAVRAVGFREHAFEDRFGPERYRWLRGLGNKAILTGARYGEFVDPSAAGDLLEFAVEMNAKRRRVIFFCSCGIPNEGCHRHMVAPELHKHAKRSGQPVTVVEWPGYENEPNDDPPRVEVTSTVLRSLGKQRTSVPLDAEMPSVDWLALPWGTPVRLDAPGGEGWMLSGPAEVRAGGWQLPFLGGAAVPETGIKLMKEMRRECFLLPRASQSREPAQLPRDWVPKQTRSRGSAQSKRSALRGKQ